MLEVSLWKFPYKSGFRKNLANWRDLRAWRASCIPTRPLFFYFKT